MIFSYIGKKKRKSMAQLAQIFSLDFEVKYEMNFSYRGKKSKKYGTVGTNIFLTNTSDPLLIQKNDSAITPSEINNSPQGDFKKAVYSWESADPNDTHEDFYHKQSVEKAVYGAPLIDTKASIGIVIGFGV